ncbi:MAG: DUF167 domain-containing protein [Burkholderiaceae bacterium]|jgi:uncharacterized protein YggU (UPF0235/DUF167 family)
MRILSVRVQTHTRQSVLVEPGADGVWHARLRALPVEGAANAELIELIARHFGCPRSAVAIRRGTRSRLKHVEVALE